MKKGFTLIELLAVIVILAIIALIATPIILGIINDAREESNERSIELYASAVRNAIAAYQLTGTSAPTTFSDLDVQYDGDVVCTTQELYEDGSFYLEGCTVNGGEKKYSYGTKQGSEKACTYVDSEDDTGDAIGIIDLSDIVTCGTESFYVMSNENNEITMLSMYNLYVGDSYNYDSDKLTLLENPTNKQSELATTQIDSIIYATVVFSSENYWSSTVSTYPSYVYNKSSSLYEYVSQYEKILKEDLKLSTAEASLISYKQLEDLECPLDESHCFGAPEWVYSTSYWTGIAYSEDEVLYLREGSDFLSDRYDYYGSLGVRPVITISTSDIQ